MERKKILRAIDANFNRCKEGLRVVEDSFRFINENNALRKRIRRIRHRLDCITNNSRLLGELLEVRNTKNDPGKALNRLEMKRRNSFDITQANFQRAKESARVMEELFKILDKNKVKVLKEIRYDIYTAEKEAHRAWSSLCNSR